MTEKPIRFSTDMVRAIRDGCKTMTRRVVPERFACAEAEPGLCRYKKGDRLWVRETWSDFYGDVIYKADEDRVSDTFRWKPSIHMPRAAARLFLEVTDVRVERLQDITEVDARHEGLFVKDTGADADYETSITIAARPQFITLWDSLYARRGDGWDANPWVYAIEFRRVK